MKRFLAYSVFTLLGVGVGTLIPPTNELRHEVTRLQQDNAYLLSELERDDAIFMSVFGDRWRRERPVYRTQVTVTSYSSTIDQCDDTPHVTADGSIVRVGVLAVSSDLIHELGLRMGQRVLLTGYGLFEVRDRMNDRWHRRVDVWTCDRQAALLHGVQEATLLWFGKG